MEYLHVASDRAAQSRPLSSLWTLTYEYFYFNSRISCVYYVLWASYVFCFFIFVTISIKTYNTSPSLRNTLLNISIILSIEPTVSSVAMMVNLYSFLSTLLQPLLWLYHIWNRQHFCVKLVSSRWCSWCTVQTFRQKKINKCKYM